MTREAPARPDPSSALCTRCGLCCDGTLFADVELAGRAEAASVALLGLEVEDDPGEPALLVQPCTALRARRCTVYAHRPGCCRTFECRLLRDVRGGAVASAQALEHVREARSLVRRAEALLARLRAGRPRWPLGERVATALSAPATGASALRAQTELHATHRALEALLRAVFLGPRGPRRR